MASDFRVDALEVALFWVGDWRLGVVGSQVRFAASLQQANTVQEPAKVQDISALLLESDRPAALELATNGRPSQILCLALPDGDLLLRVGGPVELVRIAAPCIHPLPPLLAARTHWNQLRALAQLPGNPTQALIPLLQW
ncbi:MAG: hypothetical protein K9K38_12510 [Rhodoferax sp.]|nr:hypothetical protein [Rhodoferax sp.]